MRERINRELEQQGKPKAFDSRPLGAFISGVVSVQLGSYGPPVLSPGSAPSPPRRRGPIFATPSLDNFTVFVDEIRPRGERRRRPSPP